MDAIRPLTAVEDDFNTACSARRAIFLRMCEILNHAQDSVSDTHQSVWSPVSMIPRPGDTANIRANRDSILWLRSIGKHTFSYSLAIRMGDVRIGMVLPLSLEGVSERITTSSLHLYPGLGLDFPYPVTRYLSGQGVLIDFVFTGRFGAFAFTREALEARSPDHPAIESMADALAHELIHINHGVMHVLSEHGYILREDSISDLNEQGFFELEIDLTRHEIIQFLSIEPARLHHVSGRKYFVFVPKEGPEHDRIASAIAHLKERNSA